jgi:hypothetical protein
MIQVEQREREQIERSWLDLKAEFQAKALILGLLVRGEDGVLIPDGRLMRWAANAAIKARSNGGDWEGAKTKLGKALRGIAEKDRFGYLLKFIEEESYARGIEWLGRELDKRDSGHSAG